MNGHTNGHSKLRSLPSAKAFPLDYRPNVTIQPPLTRRGKGPGLLLLVPDDLDLSSSSKTLDPPPLQKWAEEGMGFAVAQIKVSTGSYSVDQVDLDLAAAVPALEKLEECTMQDRSAHYGDMEDKIGLIYLSEDPFRLYIDCAAVVAVVNFGSKGFQTKKPQLRHATGTPLADNTKVTNLPKTHTYAGAGDYFVIPSHKDFSSAAAAVAHTRTLTFLKPIIGGPYFDLEGIWEEHTRFEFAERAVEKTMATMVQEPYVNHVPTITGGIGREPLTKFYSDHFIFNNPADTAMELVSRTVGIDRVIDEFIFRFTHDKVIDWILPGVPPTGRYVEIPFTSVVNIRGDRLYHEHIAWDQASVLRQLGLMPEYLPFPYPVQGKDGQPDDGKKWEYRVPTAGIETAKKLVDENAVESNGLFEFGIREVR